MVIETANRLVENICALGLIGSDEASELRRLAEILVNSRDLAREIIRREWLTAYQINQLARGKSASLVVGPYHLLERIGVGGMGEVFRARHHRLHRIAAIKVISEQHLENSLAVQRFLREVEAAAQLSHPNIVAVHDAGRDGERYYLAMEYIDGIDLSKLLKQVGRLPIELACEFIKQVAVGLHHAHELGFIHRDIKPQNLLVAPRGGLSRVGIPLQLDAFADATVKILDMGLVQRRTERHQATELALTQQGLVIGTTDYLSPEQARNARRVDPRSDLYSLGCTLFHLLTGQPPFPGGSHIDKLLRHQTDEPPCVRTLRPEVSEELAMVVKLLMAKHPDDRFSGAAEVVTALTSVMDPSALAEIPVSESNDGPSEPLPEQRHETLQTRDLFRWEEETTSGPIVRTPINTPSSTRIRTLRQPPQDSKPWPWIIGGILLAGLLLGLLFLSLGSKSTNEKPSPNGRKKVEIHRIDSSHQRL